MLDPRSSAHSKRYIHFLYSAFLSFGVIGCEPAATVQEPAAVWSPSSLPNIFETRVERIEFPNGTRAILAKTPSIPDREDRVFVGVYVEYGKGSESIPELAHLNEHLAANSRVTLKNYIIAPDVKTLNGNAMTRLDYTSVWRVVKPQDLEPFLPERANHLEGIVRTEAVFNNEVKRVKAEHERTISRQETRGIGSTDLLKMSYFGDDYRSREDTINILNGIDASYAFDEVEDYYRPDNGLLVVVGNFDIDKTASDLQKYLPIYTPRAGSNPKTGNALKPYRGRVTQVDERSKLSKVSIGFDLPDRRSDDFLAFLIFDQLMTGGRQQTGELRALTRAKTAPLSAVMFDMLDASEIGDDRWYPFDPPYLASHSPSYATQSYESEVFHDPDFIERTLKSEFARIVAEDLSDENILRAKMELLTYMNNWMQGPDYLSLADHLAAFEFIDADPSRLNRLDNEILALDADLIRKVAKSYIDDRPIRIAIVLPKPTQAETN